MIEVQNFSPRKALLYPSAQVYEWGTTLVVAPYPDYQLLSCGGAIALLRQMGYRVRTLFVGDGQSMINEKGADSSVAQRQMVQQESLGAMSQVGIVEEANVYLQLRDGLFPHLGEPGFEESVRLVLNELNDLEPDTVVLPTLSHDQSDLQATWQIFREALRRFSASVKVVEYASLATQASDNDMPKPTAERKVWRLDISEVLDQKVKALQQFQHRQATVAPFMSTIRHWETYLE